MQVTTVEFLLFQGYIGSGKAADQFLTVYEPLSMRWPWIGLVLGTMDLVSALGPT